MHGCRNMLLHPGLANTLADLSKLQVSMAGELMQLGLIELLLHECIGYHTV